MKNKLLLSALFIISSFSVISAQKIVYEDVAFQLLREPVFKTDAENRNYTLVVNSPYNITKNDVLKDSKLENQKKLDNYYADIEKAKAEHQLRLQDYEAEVKKLQEKYKIESEQYSKLTTVEKALNDKGSPVLRLPSRPELNIPSKPNYYEPDLTNVLIVDNKVLASQINISGFVNNGNYLDVTIDLKRTNFQDNAGKTFANQPVTIIAKLNNVVKFKKTYFTDFEEIASSPTNQINLNLHEKNYLQKVIKFVNSVLNENFGYQTINSSIGLETVKNKGDYDDLEKAYIYVTTNLRKLQAKTDYEPNKVAMENMQKGINIWKETLTKIDYKNEKALLNAKIAQYLYFDLMKLNLALGNKKEAEFYLNDLQEHLVDIKLSYSAKNELKQLEEAIYKN